MKIATWNVNSINVRLEHVLQWLDSAKPDVLALQELKMAQEKIPIEAIRECGYHVVANGQRTYNGVAIISQEPADEDDLTLDIPGFEDHQKRVISATIGGVRIINVYIPNGQSIESDKFVYKMQWLEHLRAYVAQQMQQYPKLILLGDYNIAPDDRDVHDPEKWEGKLHCSEPERQAFSDFLDLGLSDAFRIFEPDSGFYSWWDYRQAAFRRDMGLRIDHILVSEALAKACIRSSIDKEPRKWERPSDHTPVIAEFA